MLMAGKSSQQPRIAGVDAQILRPRAALPQGRWRDDRPDTDNSGCRCPAPSPASRLVSGSMTGLSAHRAPKAGVDSRRMRDPSRVASAPLGGRVSSAPHSCSSESVFRMRNRTQPVNARRASITSSARRPGAGSGGLTSARLATLGQEGSEGTPAPRTSAPAGSIPTTSAPAATSRPRRWEPAATAGPWKDFAAKASALRAARKERGAPAAAPRPPRGARAGPSALPRATRRCSRPPRE